MWHSGRVTMGLLFILASPLPANADDDHARAGSRAASTPSETVLCSGTAYLRDLDVALTTQKILRPNGTTAERIIDHMGRSRDLAQLQAAAEVAAFRRRGTASEPLARLAAESPPGIVVPVVLWSSRPMPWIRKELLDTSPREASRQLAELRSARDAAIGDLLLLLALYGLDGEPIHDLPAVRAVVSTELVVPIASEPEVGRMGLAGTRVIPTASTFEATTGADEVHGWGWTGSGKKVGVILSTKPSTTPCLSFSNRRWLTSSSSVEAKVAHGVVKSTTTATCTPSTFGVAPAASIYSADPLSSGGCDGVCWALGQGAVVVAAGWSEASSLEGEALIDEHDATLDSLVRLPPYPVIIASAGNSNDASGSACSSDPDAGYVQNHLYNGLVVGGIDEAGTSGFGDDTMYECSSWRNPASPHGDRELPHLVAPAVDVDAAGAGPATGTSIAAATTAGIAALVLQSNSALANWPEATRAILMASAHGDFDGAPEFGCLNEASGCGRDGHGLVSAPRAVGIAAAHVLGEPGQTAAQVGHDYGM